MQVSEGSAPLLVATECGRLRAFCAPQLPSKITLQPSAFIGLLFAPVAHAITHALEGTVGPGEQSQSRKACRGNARERLTRGEDRLRRLQHNAGPMQCWSLATSRDRDVFLLLRRLGCWWPGFGVPRLRCSLRAVPRLVTPRVSCAMRSSARALSRA